MLSLEDVYRLLGKYRLIFEHVIPIDLPNGIAPRYLSQNLKVITNEIITETPNGYLIYDPQGNEIEIPHTNGRVIRQNFLTRTRFDILVESLNRGLPQLSEQSPNGLVFQMIDCSNAWLDSSILLDPKVIQSIAQSRRNQLPSALILVLGEDQISAPLLKSSLGGSALVAFAGMKDGQLDKNIEIVVRMVMNLVQGQLRS